MKKLLHLMTAAVSCVLAFWVFEFEARGEGVMLGVDGGRYVMGKTSEMRADTFVIDTDTGRLWRLTIDEESQRPFMSPINFIDAETGALAPVPPSESESDEQRVFSISRSLRLVESYLEVGDIENAEMELAGAVGVLSGYRIAIENLQKKIEAAQSKEDQSSDQDR
jgi:hypothetical protein